MDLRLIPVYFVVGGVSVTVITYFGGQGKGPLAAFVGLLPTVTLITMITIYLQAGVPAAESYAKNLLKLLPPWILYVVSIIVLLPRIGLIGSLAVGMAVYLVGSFVIIRFV